MDEPPLKLYRVTFELEIYVMAVNRGHARETAEEAMREDMAVVGCEVDTEVPSLATIPLESRESIPWGSEDERTVEQIIMDAAVTMGDA